MTQGLFETYFMLGWNHILDWNGYDHILFITALGSMYGLDNVKQLVFETFTFTIGHSLALGLSVFGIWTVSTKLVEWLIPLTIIGLTFVDVLPIRFGAQKKQWFVSRIIIILLFGLIHGLGFSNFLKSMLVTGEQFGTQMFIFNIGLEAGQLFLLLIVIGTFTLLKKCTLWNITRMQIALNIIVAIVAFYLLLQRPWPF